MSGRKGNSGSRRPQRTRTIEVAPITRAVRIALAASAIALASSGAAFAGTCSAPDTDNTIHCNGDFVDTITYDTSDLTLVVGDDIPSSVIPPPSHDGIVVTATGALAITTHADITTDSGIALSAIGRTVDVTNTGTIDTAGFQDAGVSIRGSDSASFANTGSITARSYFSMAGIDVASDGDIQVRNEVGADVYAQGRYSAIGVQAFTTQGDVVVENAGEIRARVGGSYYGEVATGISAFSNAGNVMATNDGSIEVREDGFGQKANGIVAIARAGVASVDNAGSISAYSNFSQAFGIAAQAREVVVDNSGSIEATTAEGYTSIGILALATEDATVTNSGQIRVDGIGIYSHSDDGEASVDNSGDLTVFSGSNLPADGIFASGIGVDVVNIGSINATGDAWAAGIEAQGTDDLTRVTNSGAITATAGDTGYAWGLYATGGDGGIDIGTSSTSDIAVAGGSAIGIKAYASGTGGIAIHNDGDISTEGVIYSTGISATSNVDGSAISVDNSGDIKAVSGFYATGIEVVTTGGDADGSLDNTGNVYAGTSSKYPASGLVVSSTGDAAIGNSGSVTTVSGSVSYGALALSLAGDANVTNSGDIDATGGSFPYYGGAYGIVAEAQYGTAGVTNSGSVTANGATVAGIDVSGASGSTVSNSGTIATAGTFYAFGILASSSEGDTTVSNTGAITTAGKYAYGVAAVSSKGDVSVANGAAGTITVAGNNSFLEGISFPGIALGAFAAAGTGNAAISNDGAINASNAYGSARGIQANAAGDVALDNGGSITVTATGDGIYGASDAIGIYGYAPGGTVSISNAGDITVASDTGLADGIFASGLATDVDNSGAISVTGNPWAAGIEAQGYDAATISNSGTIEATAAAGDPIFDPYGYGIVLGFENGGQAYGIYGTGGEGGLGITTTDGSAITVSGALATGIHAYDSGAAGIAISNAGDITASGYYATGIHAATNVEGSDIAIDNSGDISADGAFGGTGIEALATGAGASGSVSNSGDIVVSSPGYYGAGTGIVVSADGDANIDNAGSLTVSGYYGPNYGALALAFAGDANVSNSGDITVASGYGVVSSSQNGLASATNSGSITVTGGPFGMQVDGAAGTTVSNSGTINMSDGKYNFAIQATSSLGDVAVDNSGTIVSGLEDGSDKYTFGVLARASQGDTAVGNSGAITTTGKYSYGIEAIADLGDVSVGNAAAGVVTSTGTSVAVGVFAVATEGDVVIGNGGSVTATGIDYAALAVGAFGRADAGNVAITNSGDIAASNVYGSASGVQALATLGDITIDNSGTITATAVGMDGTDYYGEVVPVNAVGLQATAAGDITVANAGVITATDLDRAVAVSLDGATSTLDNSGTLNTYTANEGRIAVEGIGGASTINNTGDIHGAVVTAGGVDTFNNNAGGLWDAGNHATDFGAGNDAIHNEANGTIRLANASIALGSGNNTFENHGIIRVEGSSLVDMGAGADVEANAARTLPMAGAVPSLNASPLVNDGVIDFLDGAPDDMLTIVGDLGGDGALNIDLSPLNGSSDMLYVDGSVVSGSSQQVNVALPAGTLTSQALSAASVEFAQVSGDSSADSFVPGAVVGYAPNDFLSIGMNITSQIDTSNATNDLFSVQLEASGLNDTGVLAASIAPGVQSLMTSQIGTWRQRMGVVPRTDDTGLGAFVRTFRDKGEIDPSHQAINFGQAGNFDFDQTNSGTEVGVNFEPVNGINLGVTLAKSDARQNLVQGAGTDKLQADTIGVYGTWVSPTGFYLDASYRAMRFDAKLQSAAGVQKTSGRAGAINLEVGYAWTLSNGLNIEPQFQYTWTTVDNVFLRDGDAYFRSDDGDWQRGRLGVAFWKPFATASGITWTPYGAASAVRTADGGNGYTINDDFLGNTSTKGTSALVELGVGMQKDGFSASAGANWSDGGALQSFVGGQLVLRYDW